MRSVGADCFIGIAAGWNKSPRNYLFENVVAFQTGVGVISSDD